LTSVANVPARASRSLGDDAVVDAREPLAEGRLQIPLSA
jgi:hypothetical protein